MPSKKKSPARRRTRKAYGPDHPNWRERGPGGSFSKASSLDANQGGTEQRLPVDIGSLDGGGPRTESLEAAALEASTQPFVELGATGLRHYSGIVDEEFLPQLRGFVKRMQIFQEMRDNDATVGAMAFAIEMLMRGVSWRIEPASDSPADLETANFVDENLRDMAETWEDTLASVFSFLTFGFSMHEIVYKRRDGPDPLNDETSSKFTDGRIGWSKLPVRAQDTVNRWVFAPGTDRLEGLIQLPPPTFVPRAIPLPKMLHFRTSAAKQNPEGRSILRNAYRAWFFKKRVEEIEGIGVERDLAGLPAMEVPAELLAVNAPPEKKALFESIKQMLQDVRRDRREGIIIPREFDKEGNERYKFSLLSTGGRRQFDTTQIVNRYDRQIASVVLADFIFLGLQGVGSLALGSSRTELFGLALGAWLDSVAAQFNRKAIPLLLAVNGRPIDNLPQLVHGDVETIDLAELAAYVSAIAGTGVSFDDLDTENFLRMQGGLPERDEDEVALRERQEQEAEGRVRAQLEEERQAAEAIAAARERSAGGGDPIEEEEED